jgi:hypothetical protein
MHTDSDIFAEFRYVSYLQPAIAKSMIIKEERNITQRAKKEGRLARLNTSCLGTAF